MAQLCFEIHRERRLQVFRANNNTAFDTGARATCSSFAQTAAAYSAVDSYPSWSSVGYVGSGSIEPIGYILLPSHVLLGCHGQTARVRGGYSQAIPRTEKPRAGTLPGSNLSCLAPLVPCLGS